MGDPFSRYVQLLLTITRAHDLVVVDDGTATMEFVTQLAHGERLVRWHRKGSRPGPRDLLFAPVSRSARHRLTPTPDRQVSVFSSMPIEDIPDGVTVTANDFAWTRARFGPPRITKGADMVGTSLVETGVVDADRYLDAVRALARTHGAARYFAHRRESAEKLHRLAVETGLEIVRPDLPLELIARRGPIGRTVLSFPPRSSTPSRSPWPAPRSASPSATSTPPGSPSTPPPGPRLPERRDGLGPRRAPPVGGGTRRVARPVGGGTRRVAGCGRATGDASRHVTRTAPAWSGRTVVCVKGASEQERRNRVPRPKGG